MSGKLLVLTHFGFTAAMAGFMVAVQFVIYPQFRTVNADLADEYSTSHGRLIVTGLVLLAIPEVLLALWLFLDTPDQLGRGAVFGAGILLAVAWLSTGLWFAPLHTQLASDWTVERVNLLIATNWFRTAVWVARAVVAGWFVSEIAS